MKIINYLKIALFVKKKKKKSPLRFFWDARDLNTLLFRLGLSAVASWWMLMAVRALRHSFRLEFSRLVFTPCRALNRRSDQAANTVVRCAISPVSALLSGRLQLVSFHPILKITQGFYAGKSAISVSCC